MHSGFQTFDACLFILIPAVVHSTVENRLDGFCATIGTLTVKVHKNGILGGL